jgi:hypothetical protein
MTQYLYDSFETGRVYDGPQVIEYILIKDKILFRDNSRSIIGALDVDAEDVSFFAEYGLADWVQRYYDNGAYKTHHMSHNAWHVFFNGLIEMIENQREEA